MSTQEDSLGVADVILWAAVSCLTGAATSAVIGTVVGGVVGAATCGLCPCAAVWMIPLGCLYGLLHGLAVGGVASAPGSILGAVTTRVVGFRVLGAIAGGLAGVAVGYYLSEAIALGLDFAGAYTAEEGGLKTVPRMARPWFVPVGVAGGVTGGVVAGFNPNFLRLIVEPTRGPAPSPPTAGG